MAPVVLFQLSGFPLFLGFAAFSEFSAFCLVLSVGGGFGCFVAVFWSFAVFGFYRSGQFLFSTGRVFSQVQRNPQQVGSLLFRAAVGFVVLVILAVHWSLTSRIKSPPLAAGRPLRGRPCALALG